MRKLVTFQSYLKKKGLQLKPWQNAAANALLEIMAEHQEGETGKTFLLKHLRDFEQNHGNDFDVEKDEEDIGFACVRSSENGRE